MTPEALDYGDIPLSEGLVDQGLPNPSAMNGASTSPLTPIEPPSEPKQWRVVGASVQGSGHQKTQTPCQDAHHFAVLLSNNSLGRTLLIAVADGAGSAPMSEHGSRVAARTAVEQAAIEVKRIEAEGATSDDEAWKAALVCAMEAAQEAVEGEAEAKGANPLDLATTLILVISTPEMVASAQVGDGATVMSEADGIIWPLTVPQSGEYINETTFITSPKALEKAQVIVRRAEAQHIAAFSDGLQMLALKMPQATPHQPFFAPLFDFVGKSTDENLAHEELTAFLRSPRIRQRTDDDLTLVIAASHS